jgi:hypothetical protein
VQEDEMVMITDMDMLPCHPKMYTDGLDAYQKHHFLTYHPVLWRSKEIFMCYNAAHPETWATVMGMDVSSSASSIPEQIIHKLRQAHIQGGDYSAGGNSWFIDQHTLFAAATQYPYFVQLDRRIRRLEMPQFRAMMQTGQTDFYCDYDDAHFHRSFHTNEDLIYEALRQLSARFPHQLPSPSP